MRSPKEVIRLMLSTGRYLSNEQYLPEKFMCNAATAAKEEGVISDTERLVTLEFIGKALCGAETLSLHLCQCGAIPHQSEYFGLRGYAVQKNDLRLQFWAFLLWFTPGI